MLMAIVVMMVVDVGASDNWFGRSPETDNWWSPPLQVKRNLCGHQQLAVHQKESCYMSQKILNSHTPVGLILKSPSDETS